MLRKACILGVVLVLTLTLIVFQGQIIGLSNGDKPAPPPPPPPGGDKKAPPKKKVPSKKKKEKMEEKMGEPIPDLEVISGDLEVQSEGYKVSLLVEEGGVDCSQVPIEIWLSPMKAWMGEWPFLIRKEKPDLYQANKEEIRIVIFVEIPENWSEELKKHMEFWYEVKDRDPEKDWLFIRLNRPFPEEEQNLTNNRIWIPLP